MSVNGSSGNVPLNSEMRCSIVSNSNGDIVILHDQKMPSDLQWIEFDLLNKKLFLIHDDGTPQDLGIALDAKMASNISHGLKVSLVHMNNDIAVARQIVTIVIQDY